MDDYLNSLLPFLSVEQIDKLYLVSIVLFSAYIFNYILKERIRKYSKIYCFHQRGYPFFRLVFNRYDKLFRPIRLLINIYFFELFINIFILNASVAIILELIYSFVFIWFSYEVIKFALYGFLIRKIHKEKVARKELFNLFLNITKIIIVLVIVVVVLLIIGVDVTAFVTSLGIGGAILALSAKDTLTNFFDSLRLISSDAFRQGDWIQTKEVEGFVTEVGLITTKIRTFSNAFVTVPNSKLANNYIHNWSKRMVGRKIKFDIRLKIKNNKDELDKVIKEILYMLNNHHDIVNDEKIEHLIRANKTYDDGLFNVADKYGVRKTMLVYLDKIDVYSMDIMIYVFSISVDWKGWLHTKQDVIKAVIEIIDNSSLEFAYPKEEIMLNTTNTKNYICKLD
ncbi:MAG TPA: mechanosensitive ion channel [Arcobacter sp.]|nr:mechanosensitive ion channel [Arcobacter sp.]